MGYTAILIAQHVCALSGDLGSLPGVQPGTELERPSASCYLLTSARMANDTDSLNTKLCPPGRQFHGEKSPAVHESPALADQRD